MLETPRLHLRQWQDSDLPVFAAMNADTEVMAYFPATLSEDESNAMADRCRALIAERGWGFWAAELKATQQFIGFVGLHVPSASLPCSPCVEIGWRLAKPYWGWGYASEAARSALAFAFETLALEAVVSFTTTANARSRAVMQRIGMRDTGNNFRHPGLPPGHLLAEHVLYQIDRPMWQQRAL